MRIFPIIKKITNIIISGVVNFRANVKPAIRLTWVGTFTAAFQKPATRVSFAAATLRAALQKAGTRITASISGVISALQKPATRITQSPFNLLAALQKPATRVSFGAATLTAAKPISAGNIVQITWDLTHTSYIVTASNDVGATQNWANPTNAQGAPDASLAAFDGQALLLAAGILRGVMVAQPNRPSTLTILEVYLDFYGSVTGLPIVSDLVSRLNLRYRINTAPIAGAETTLQSITTGAPDFTGTPLTFRINRTGVDSLKFTDGATAALSTDVTWANIALIQPNFDAAVILGLVAAHYKAAAVKLRVIAQDIQIN